MTLLLPAAPGWRVVVANYLDDPIVSYLDDPAGICIYDIAGWATEDDDPEGLRPLIQDDDGLRHLFTDEDCITLGPSDNRDAEREARTILCARAEREVQRLVDKRQRQEAGR